MQKCRLNEQIFEVKFEIIKLYPKLKPTEILGEESYYDIEDAIFLNENKRLLSTSTSNTKNTLHLLEILRTSE